jgi:arginyl-tRNA synthetase
MTRMKQELSQAIAAVCKNLFDTDVRVVLVRPDEQFGDYATNVALQLAKQIGKNPREVAQMIVAGLQDANENLATANIAGPGFINLVLTDQALYQEATTKPEAIRNDTVVIETNNPNPFKAMHIGHAFNAILGDTIANIIEAAGASTYRVSYHGDVGLHVGKSMYSLLRYVEGDPAKLNDIPAVERNRFMSKMYAEGSRAYKEDDAARTEIEALTKQSFTREDQVYAAVYDTCIAWSFEQIDDHVRRLGNVPIRQRFLESDAEHRGVKIVKENVPKVFQESDGALVFAGSMHGAFDNAFVSARGTGLYAARDLGLMQLKNEQYHPDKSYIVTAEEQRDYFKGVIAAAELCMPELKGVTTNISTGMVKLSSGKMSSRTGDVIEIDWLFDQVAEAIKERGGQATDEMVAGVLRYQFLSVRIGSDVVFDVNEAVSVTGNSGPYLQYAHARARSILSKVTGNNVATEGVILEPDERSLVRKISEYPETVARATSELMPHHICGYLYELAQVFNRFYEKNRVLDDPRQNIRLQLVLLYADTLRDGLRLLGISAPDSM